MSDFEKNLSVTKKMIDAEKMLSQGVSLSVIAKTLGVPLIAIHQLKDKQQTDKSR